MNFKKNVLSSSVAAALMGTTVHTLAQEEPILEEVVVVGIRASMMRAMDLKRDAKGVVEGISAEDIGKFPDTNLAESLQRISGVSIDRSNNEGSKVTVRGFGPEFNLVTLNGRQMPTSQTGNDQSQSTRSFDFSNLAAESVSGVEVYKTANATLSSGGIGSTINIITARPLTSPGLNTALSIKGVMDTTNEKGDDITPEISGLFSNTFADDTIGVGLSLSQQTRDSRREFADTDNWIPNPADVPITGTNNNPFGNVWYPQNIGYNIEDIERKRTNGQLVFQWAATDTLEATLDYTYSEVETESNATGFGIWFTPGGNTNEAIVDGNGTTVFVNETGGDLSSNKSISQTKSENNSIGLNLDWQATDSLNLEFDFHDSDAESENYGNDNGFFILGVNAIDNKTYDSRGGGDIPSQSLVFDPTARGIVNGEATADAYDSLFGQANEDINKSEVTQFQFNGEWNNDVDSGLTSINFGLARTESTFRVQSFRSQNLQAGFYAGNQDLYDNSLLERVNVSGILDEFDRSIDIPYYYDWQFSPIVRAGEQAFGWTFDPLIGDNGSGGKTDDHEIEEITDAVYLAFNVQDELHGMPLTIFAGLRWETTDVTAGSLNRAAESVTWFNPTEWVTNFADTQEFTDVGGDYTVWLPNLDISLEFVDNVVGRFSYGRTMTRPSLIDMRGTFSVVPNPQLNQRTANQGNPGLLPFISDNFDLSVEWYYGEASYASIGYFRKQVENFIVTEVDQQPIDGLRDVFLGPRADQARADLTTAGQQLTVENIHDQINQNAGNPSGTAIDQAADDPLITWDVSTPRNFETAELYGWEFAIQHVFESGFGIMANLTLVDGDLDVDNGISGFQFVLPGLSDSANLVGFYERAGFQARIAYNWRDEFLAGTNAPDNAPLYTEEFAQIDANMSYDLPWVEGLTVFAEAINLTDESQRQFQRYDNQFKSASQFGARYNLGLRMKF